MNYLNLPMIGNLLAVNDVYAERLRQLDSKMCVSTLHGIAKSSQKNFKTHVNTYVEFCIYFGLPLFPADSLQMRRYLQYLSDFHKSVDSSRSYVTGVRSLHEIFGFPPPPGDHLYQLTVSGIRRDKGHVVRQAMGMTPEILAEMCPLVQLTDPVQFTAWVAILSGFYLLLRKSNLVPDSVPSFSADKQLTRSNFIRFKDCYVVRVYWSKTIQYFDRCLDILMLPNPDVQLCPVYWLDRYFSMFAANPFEPAFCWLKAHTNQSLTYTQLTF